MNQGANSIVFIIPIAVATYVATNIDNLILLVSFWGRYRSRARYVVAGYLACMTVLGFMAFLIGKVSVILPVQHLGLLGIVPIFMGLSGILDLYRGKATTTAVHTKPIAGKRSAFVAIFASQLSIGTDTVLAFGALFADSLPSVDVLILITMAIMAVSFVFIANYAIHQPVLRESIKRYAYRVTPFIFVIVGAYILTNTATDLMPDW